MTMREASLALEGDDLKYREQWRRAVLVANSNGANIKTLDEVLKAPYQPSKADVADLNARAVAAFERQRAAEAGK